MNWDDLKLCLALARGGSLAAAAARLGIDETTVSRRLRRAEAELGQPLFHRAPGEVSPTEAGAALLLAAERAEIAAEQAVAAATGRDSLTMGTVRVTSVPILINRLLAPHTAPFLAENPGLSLDLIPDSRDYSLLRREADLALRLARPRSEAKAICRRVGTLAYGAYGQEGTPWIGYVAERAALPQAAWLSAAGAASGVRVADAETAIALVAAGAGRSALPVALVPPDLPRCTGAPPARELWLLAHPETHRQPKIRAAADWIATLCRALPHGGTPSDWE